MKTLIMLRTLFKTLIFVKGPRVCLEYGTRELQSLVTAKIPFSATEPEAT